MPVFISYASEDITMLNNSLVEVLTAREIPYMSDESIENGEEIPNKLLQIIQKCEVCILLATTNSLRSEWCKMEMAAFWATGKRVIILSLDNSIKKSDLPQYMQNNNYSSSISKVVDTAQKEIARFAIKGPPELTEEAKKLSAMIEPFKLGSIQALNESKPMLKVILEYFAATRNNIEQLNSENCHISVPATEYPNYLIALQKMPNTYVRAIAIIDDIEHFWDGETGDRILQVSDSLKTKRVFIFKDQKDSGKLRTAIKEHCKRYDVRLTSKQTVLSNIYQEHIHDFSLIWSSDAQPSTMLNPPAGTILAQYKMLHGKTYIEFSSESSVVGIYWQKFVTIYDNAIVPEKNPEPNIGLAISHVFGQQNKEMSNYIPDVHKYDTCERRHPYFNEMRHEMLAQLRTWERNSPKVWEVGAGTGILSEEIVTILKTNGGKLLSIEYDSDYYTYLLAKFRQQPKVGVRQKDAKNYDPEGKFDLIFSAFADHHIVKDDKDAKQYYENIRKNIFDSDSSFFIVGDEFLREHNRANSDERTEAIKAYHNHIIEQARIEMEQAPADRLEEYQGLIELETEARESGIRAVIDPTSPNSGDYKVSISHFTQRIEKAGLRIDSIVPIGPQDESIRNRVGGIFVIKIRLP
jgi:hypothetical protein